MKIANQSSVTIQIKMESIKISQSKVDSQKDKLFKMIPNINLCQS